MSKVSSPLPNPLPLAGEGTNEKNILIDEHAGKGGSYEMRDGVRVLIERTGHVPDGTISHSTKPASGQVAGYVEAQPAAPTESAATIKTTKSKVKGADNA